MQLEIRHLRLVSEIAALGSMTKAAERLHLTQSALSHQLRDIEARLGTPFFLRLGRTMVPTPAGERVLASAQAVLEDLATVERDVRRLADEGSGVIRVCTQCNTGYHWLPPLLKSFHLRHPKVEVQIMVEATMKPLETLLAGRLDVAVMTDPVKDKRVTTRLLFRDELVALVSPHHRLASRAVIEAADLADEHLIIYSSSRADSYVFRRILTPAGVEPTRVSQIHLTEAILEMVKANLGVTILARWTAEPAIATGALRALRVTRRGVFREWTAVRLRAQESPRYLDDFLDLLAQRGLPFDPSTHSGSPRATSRGDKAQDRPATPQKRGRGDALRRPSALPHEPRSSRR